MSPHDAYKKNLLSHNLNREPPGPTEAVLDGISNFYIVLNSLGTRAVETALERLPHTHALRGDGDFRELGELGVSELGELRELKLGDNRGSDFLRGGSWEGKSAGEG
jgi:hypothetical protein